MNDTENIYSYEEIEVSFAVLTLEIFRIHSEVTQWIEKCEEFSNESGLGALDIVILSLICHGNGSSPKSINIISNILNKNDDLSVNYVLKKLSKINLIKRVINPVSNNRSIYYCATKAGIDHMNNYRHLRKQVLEKIIKVKQVENISRIIDLLREVRMHYHLFKETIFINDYELM